MCVLVYEQNWQLQVYDVQTHQMVYSTLESNEIIDGVWRYMTNSHFCMDTDSGQLVFYVRDRTLAYQEEDVGDCLLGVLTFTPAV